MAVLQYERSHPSNPIWGLGDIDGDGRDELVESTGPALLAYDHTDGVHRTLFEVELPAGWSWLDGRGKFGPLIDFDGDGRAEIPLTLHADDRGAWRLLIVDPLARTDLLDVPLPIGQDRRREPYWDGHYSVVDTMTVAGGRLALIVFCSVLYDGLGRAVLAVDVRSGEILWRYDLGPQLRPQRETFAIGTLPGHPGRVIVLGTNSPANLDGLQVGGFSDDQARLFVLDAAGQKLWSARLDSLFALSEVRLVDLGGDGQRSIITCTLNRNQTDPARLTVWDPATRSAVFTETQASAYVGLTVLPGPRLVTMVDLEELREYTPRQDGGLAGRTIRRYPAGTLISREMASGLPGSRVGPWYVVASRDGTVLLHDQSHRVLGRFASPVPNAHPDQFASWQSGASSRLVFQAGAALVAMDLQDNTTAWTAALTGGWVLALGGGLGILLVAGRRRRDLAALRRILARRLAEVAHRDFRMVRDILEFPAFLRDRDAMQLDGYRAHIGELRRDLVETTIPHLLETLLELESAGYSPPGVGSTRRQLRAARRLLEDERSFQALVDPDSQPSRRYHHLSRDIYADFDRLYRDLHPLVCIDGAQVVQTMVTRRSPDLRAAGVSLQCALPASAPQTPVLADPAQLGFIIDGLVANAVRAMAGCDGRRPDGGRVRAGPGHHDVPVPARVPAAARTLKGGPVTSAERLEPGATRVLLVDDDRAFCRLMLAKLEQDYTVRVVHESDQVLPAVLQWRPAVVLLDIELEQSDSGLRLLADLRVLDRPLAVIMLTRDDQPETARRAGALGADGYLPKTVELAELRQTLARAVAEARAVTDRGAPESAAPGVAGAQGGQVPGLVSVSAVSRDVLERAARVAGSKATVLLLGETGVGKGVLARAIHALSGRRGPFVRCDGTTMPRELMHAELVGYREGAFTGATSHYGGHFAAAHGGTLFVDEIGEASPQLQGALLHAVETGEVTPLGEAGKPRTFDVRVIAATNRDLAGMSRRGQFKPDLLARLNVYPLVIPPLRERREDILPLAQHYLARFAAEEGRPPLRLSPAARVYLTQHDWPENVRGIENAMRRAVIDAVGEVVELQHLVASTGHAGHWLRPYAEFEAEHLGRLQRDYLRVLLADTGGQVSEAAQLSGVTRKTIYEWLKRHGMRAEDFRGE